MQGWHTWGGCNRIDDEDVALDKGIVLTELIYKEIYGFVLKKWSWRPVNVIGEKCGKIKKSTCRLIALVEKKDFMPIL